MDTMGQFLGGLGLLGILGGVLLAGIVLVLLPWCALVECVRSRRGPTTKSILVVALVVTWGFGAIVYGLFVTSSRALRIFTVVGVVIPTLILVPSVMSFVSGAKMNSALVSERERAEVSRIVSEFQPAPTQDALDPFLALHFAHGKNAPRAASLARFTLQGPDYGTARDVDTELRHVVHDGNNERFFALTRHDFGTITPSTGRFTGIEVDPTLDEFAWPKGIAFDAAEQAVIVMTSHVYTRFYRYDPRTSDWAQLPSRIRDLSLVALAYSPDENCLYALEHEYGDAALRNVHRFNGRGANLGGFTLNPPIPIVRRQTDSFQLQYSSGKLVVLLPPLEIDLDADAQPSVGGGGNRIFAIDPRDGQVSVLGVSVARNLE